MGRKKCITEWQQLAQVRIVPLSHGYMIEVVYEQQEEQADVEPQWVDILAALTSNKPGFQPCLLNGRPLKSENQWYNVEVVCKEGVALPSIETVRMDESWLIPNFFATIKSRFTLSPCCLRQQGERVKRDFMILYSSKHILPFLFLPKAKREKVKYVLNCIN